jgi:tetratricopeptide (TPR) repeat protein
LARDFDLMSLTLFAPVLLLLDRVGGKRPVPLRVWLICSVLSLMVTFSYLAANCSQEKSITRAHDLLQYYETKSKRAWQSFAKFLEADGQPALVEHVKAEISSLFPEEVKFQTAISLIASDKLAEAEFLLQELLRAQPDNGEYLVALSDIRAAQGNFRQVRLLLEKAIKTHPNHGNFLSLGQACLIERDFAAAIEALERAYKLAPGSQDIVTELCKACFFGGRPVRARELAAKLLAMNPNSADGNIITMIFLLQDGRKSEAAHHYRQFLRYGQDHPDYEAIKETYKELSPRR